MNHVDNTDKEIEPRLEQYEDDWDYSKVPEALKYALVMYAYTRLKFEHEQRYIEEFGETDEEKVKLRQMFEDGYFSLTVGGRLMHSHTLKEASKDLIGDYMSQITENKHNIPLIRDLPDEEIEGLCAMVEYDIEYWRGLFQSPTRIGPAKHIFNIGDETHTTHPYISPVKGVFGEIQRLRLSEKQAARLELEFRRDLAVAEESDNVEDAIKAANTGFLSAMSSYDNIERYYRNVSKFGDKYTPNRDVVENIVLKIKAVLPDPDERDELLHSSGKLLEDLSGRLQE